MHPIAPRNYKWVLIECFFTELISSTFHRTFRIQTTKRREAFAEQCASEWADRTWDAVNWKGRTIPPGKSSHANVSASRYGNSKWHSDVLPPRHVHIRPTEVAEFNMKNNSLFMFVLYSLYLFKTLSLERKQTETQTICPRIKRAGSGDDSLKTTTFHWFMHTEIPWV